MRNHKIWIYVLTSIIFFYLFLNSFFDFYLYDAGQAVAFNFNINAEELVFSLLIGSAMLIALFLKSAKKFVFASILTAVAFIYRIIISWDFLSYYYELLLEGYSFYFLTIVVFFFSTILLFMVSFIHLPSKKVLNTVVVLNGAIIIILFLVYLFTFFLNIQFIIEYFSFNFFQIVLFFFNGIFFGFLPLLVLNGAHTLPILLTLRSEASFNEVSNHETSDEEDDRVSVGFSIFLSLVTLGIYYFVWIYKISSKLKRLGIQQQDPTTTVVLAIFIPFYVLFWLYKTGEQVYQLQRSRQTENNASLYIVLALFGLSIVALALIQKDLNDMNSNELMDGPVQNNKQPAYDQSSSEDTMKILENLYALYLKGAITEQEYIEKKKVLLEKI
jgi:hypothetical protein